jgi:hypothetical protein
MDRSALWHKLALGRVTCRGRVRSFSEILRKPARQRAWPLFFCSWSRNTQKLDPAFGGADAHALQAHQRPRLTADK